jgi:chromate transporter
LQGMLLYFLKPGSTGFGGPLALIGSMDRELVEERRWITRGEYLEGLAFSQPCPGPLAGQLAMYFGWLRGGFAGATLVSIAFTLPSYLMAVAIAALYTAWGSMPWIGAVFYGVTPAVIAIIALSAWRLAGASKGGNPLLISLLAITAPATMWEGADSM